MKPIIIEPSSLEWANEFVKIKEYLWRHVRGLVIDIIHIGSTSVLGLASKPIIDFNIIIESYDVFPQLMEQLRNLGYEHDGDGGLPMRERFIGGNRDDFMDHNMYVSPIESRVLLAQVLFRDYLRRYNDILNEYALLKQSLAEKYRNDIVAYVNGKHEFIMKVVNLAMKEKKFNLLEDKETTCIIDRIVNCNKNFIAEYDAN